MNKKTENKTQKNAQDFVIQRLYAKDLSFEAPNSPEVFNSQWQPEVNLDLNINNNSLGDDTYEVIIKVLVTVKLPQKTAFLVEANYAGIFTVKGFEGDQLKAMLGSFCPSILFPYAREVISDLINRGGFPPLYLAPINFDALYQQQLDEQKNKT